MVQREVADRLAAQPGELSLLGLAAQLYARVEVVARVPAGAFVPRPKVESAIIKLTPHSEQPDLKIRARLFEVARAGFGSRRKTLENALLHGLSLPRRTAHDLLVQAKIDPAARAQTLSLDDWGRLGSAWARYRGES
jgi:16S rRNA (adenine1518-N6/adenine1519-N6)-dimethyltransferase